MSYHSFDIENQKLDILGENVKKLKVIATDMNKELKSHNELIDNIKEKTENTSYKVQNARKSTQNTKESGSVIVLWIIIGILILLIILVLAL